MEKSGTRRADAAPVRELGAGLALDDFQHLAILRSPICSAFRSAIKIDKSFNTNDGQGTRPVILARSSRSRMISAWTWSPKA